ncbi:hypothetical protein BU14_1090s0005 [Porphyra umbilicalis]|uniref:Uncharacterized protein n=1 Tax=Porphyra umbilicalis TaxID=2786 RepID=A0A1X6NMF2_PORUM|nr:hypothetical protein BU14_1090s0005 [Porphyra umbilicalis]|eukprot:OSX69829.1 hypothetical protein BU14_1090s0005 [Porphyra umbilicalis]
MGSGTATSVSKKEVSVAAPEAEATLDSIEMAATRQTAVVHELTDSLKARLAALTTQLEEVSTTKTDLEATNAGLTKEVTASEGTALALESAQAEADRLRAELQQASTQAERNFEASQAADAAQAEADRLRAQLKLASTQAARNFEQSRDLEAQKQQVLADMEALKSADAATVERLSAALRAKAGEVEEEAAVIGDLETKVGALTVEKIDARADASAARARIDSLSEQMKRMAEERAALQDELNDEAARTAQLQGTTAALVGEKSTIANEKAEVEAALSKEEVAKAVAKEEVAALKQRIAELESELQATKDDAAGAVAEKEQFLAAVIADKADLKAELIETQTKLEKLSETRLGDLEAERQKAAALAKSLEADVAMAERTVHTVKEEVQQTSVKMSLDA